MMLLMVMMSLAFIALCALTVRYLYMSRMHFNNLDDDDDAADGHDAVSYTHLTLPTICSV
eukprot:12408904-Karenia_brevis.AAC.1